MDVIGLLASLLGVAFVSGLRLYATVFALGVGIRTGFIRLDPALARLEILADPLIIAVAGLVYVVEFVADKVPWVDSLWDSIHTLIRPLGAVVLAAVALGDVDPGVRIATLLLCGSVALASHAGKAGIRLAVNHSPEPFSNIGLSFLEDIVALAAVWLTVTHPYVMLALIGVWLVALAVVLRRIFRLAKRGATAVHRRLMGLLRGAPETRPGERPQNG